MPQWPRDNQADLIAFYGDPGSGSMALNLVKVKPPFRMTYDSKPITALTFHKLAAPSLERALNRIWDYYGRDQAKIDALGISKTAGTYNPRKIRGSDTKWSNHAYGAAIDINAEQNGFNMVGNIPIPVIAAFKAEGARWGGDYKGRTDPMHFEFCASNEPPRTFEQWLEFYGHKGGGAVPPQAKPKPKPITADMVRRMMQIIVPWEKSGKIEIFRTDGGPEIGGVTQKDHPAEYAKLVTLLGSQDKLKEELVRYYSEYTAPVQGWTDRAGPNFFLRDSFLNRGPTGAAEILQIAVGVPVDGQVGPATRSALAALDPNVAIDKLRAARELYEDEHFDNGNGKRWRQSRGQWDGLVNRWNKAQAQAKAFQKEQGSTFPVATTVGVGAGGAAAVAAYTFWDWVTAHIVPSVIIACGAAAVVVLIIRKIRGD